MVGVVWDNVAIVHIALDGLDLEIIKVFTIMRVQAKHMLSRSYEMMNCRAQTMIPFSREEYSNSHCNQLVTAFF